MWMIAFMLLPILGIAYISWHLWVLVPISPFGRCLLIGGLILSFILLFLNLGRVIDRLPLGMAQWSYDIGSSSLFVLLYLAIIFIVLDLGRLFHLVPRAWLYHNFYTSTVLLTVLFLVFLCGNIHYYQKKKVELTFPTEKAISNPIRLFMASDLHLGYHNPRKELHRWVELINSEKPDLVLIAGDLIDMSMRPLIEENMAEELRRIQAPVYACLGNHEYFSRTPNALQFFKDANITLLRDSATTVGDLTIIGRDDRTNRHRQSLAAITRRADMQKYTILLDHQPYHLEEAEGAGIDFQFSGHTHHGQVWPVSWITDAIYECAFGEHQRGATSYYVSSGLGIWGGKYRIGTRSEYVVATIHAK